MAAKVAILIAGSFVLALLQFGPGASQEIPDDKVYTELKKTLIHGSSGILTCRFTGPPYAVFWKKGHDPWNSPILMTWTPEAKTGPRYEDGSCDMNENYSMVIKTVNYTDTGRYICFVSNPHGILIDNHTDVTVTDVALKTKSAVTLQEGKTGLVPCQVYIRPKKVSWVRSTNETLVFIDLSHEVIEKSGPGYEEMLFDITEEYSLVIHDVTIQHEDNYFCVVTDYDTGNVYQGATVLTVFAYPREPFPVIKECPVNSSSSCSLRISSDTTLACQVDEYYPDIDLYFVRGSVRLQSLETKIWNNSDGTKKKRIRITADGGADTSFECVATGFVGQGFGKSMTIHFIQVSQQSDVLVAVAVPVGLILAIIGITIAAYVLKPRRRHRKRKYARVSMNFQVKQHGPDSQEPWLHNNDIRELLLHQITPPHYTKLIDAMTGIIKQYHWNSKLFGLENTDVWKDNIVEKNRTALFDSHQMIEDWWAEQNCSKVEKKCQLRDAVDILKDRTNDMVSQDAWEESDEKLPATKKLDQIAKLVPQQSMIQLCSALHIPCTPGDLNDKEKRLEVMCRWRDNMAEQKQGKRHEILSTALKAINFDGLLSRPKGRLIYKTELVDLSLELIMEDWRPFATALGIGETKFTSYIQDFRASHLKLGTISLVVQVFNIAKSGPLNKSIRGYFSHFLEKAGYPNAMKRFKFAFEPSYGELFAIATAVIKQDNTNIDVEVTETNEERNTEKEPEHDEVVEMELPLSTDDDEHPELQSDYHETPRLDASLTSIDEDEHENSSHSGDVSTEDFKLGKEPVDDIDNEIKSNLPLHEKDLGDLQRMFELTDEDIPDRNMASVLTLLKIWKERVCPGLIDHRVVLAEGLQKINKPHLAVAVINGRYQVRETSIEFIKDMLDGMDRSRRTYLKRLLNRKKRLQSSDMTSQWICDWVANWTKEMEISVKNKLKNAVRVKETSTRHRDFNDKLVDNGFLDLAREIMNIEQVV